MRIDYSKVDTSKISQHTKNLYERFVINNKYCPYQPYPKQALPIFEIFGAPFGDYSIIDEKYTSILMGGAAGSGKTLLGSILASMYLIYPGANVLVGRDTYKNLTGPSSIWDILSKELKDICTINKSSLTITSPENGRIIFRSFNRDDSKLNIKSSEFQAIILDESSEIPPGVLSFLFRSLRSSSDMKLPLFYAHLSNPAYDETTGMLSDGAQYLYREYVNGKFNYYHFIAGDNPYLTTEQYKSILENMDPLQKAAMLGDWEYKYTKGDFISWDEIKSTIKPCTHKNKISILSLDLAGTGGDNIALSTLNYDLKTGHQELYNVSQTNLPDPETMIEIHINEDKMLSNGELIHNLIIVEKEGGSWHLTERYLRELFEEYYGIPVHIFKPQTSKFSRARGFVRDMKNGRFFINDYLQQKMYYEDAIERPIMDYVAGEIGNLNPIMKVSPNIVDTISQAHIFFKEYKITI